MRRVYTKRIMCKACRCIFTITSPASKFCQRSECKKKRRRNDYAARKAVTPIIGSGSPEHLGRAIKTGD